ncbi:MAG TPA: YceD family protein [Fimbriimonadaceae bacterium]|nr:YceD family protein [Fimbriimonadaceae bacterium]
MKRQGLLDLNEAVQHPGKRLRFEVTTSLTEEEDLDLTEPVTGELTAQSTGNILLLRSTFRAKCIMECARCGEPIPQVVDFEMADEFQVEGIPACYGTGEFAKVVEEEDYPLFVKNSLDQDSYVRQGLIVNLPSQPLCEYGWEGPCPKAKAGSPREGAHGHPAMQKLKDLVHPEDD